MDEKLKKLIDLIKDDPDYQVKFVHHWLGMGNVDSRLFDSYEDATKEDNSYRATLPVIVKRSKN